MREDELRRRAASQGVMVTYRDWRGETTHVATATLRAVLAALGATAPVAVGPAPRTALRLPATLNEGRRALGLMVQLYALRSRASWGFGDLRDLADLAAWSARELGLGFVLVNPLHATEPVPPVRDSPYLPASRRFASPLYLRVEDVPEYAALEAADRARIERLSAPLHARNATLDLIDRDAVWAAKRAALEIVYRVPRAPHREAAFTAFRAREGRDLTDFTTWCALCEVHGGSWRAWPSALRDPRSEEVRSAGVEHHERVTFHAWLQWLLDEQMATAQRVAREAGMSVGIVHDLAVGAHPDGADSWMFGRFLADGVSVGAPPDEFNRRGQDWAQPPWHPGRLAAADYAPYRAILRYWLRHGGGLRLDHVMGLFRLWWIPAGCSPAQGAYVRYDHASLVGILVEEASRVGAVVVGEDLGTVEPWVRRYLSSRGVLGTSMLWFEREDGTWDVPRRPEHWRELCLATVGTHDMPPVAQYVRGGHLALRARLGLAAGSPRREAAALARELARWRELLAQLGLARPDATDDELAVALHAFLGRTPARLVGVALADAVGERRPQNLPGTSQEYPNWRIPLADGAGRPVLLDDLPERRDVRALLMEVRAAMSGVRRDGNVSATDR